MIIIEMIGSVSSKGDFCMACYQNLKDYLILNNLDVISQGIQDYIKSSSDVKFRIEDIRILTQSEIAFMPFDIATFSIGVSCEVFYADKNSVGIYYYNLMLTGDMSERFSDLRVLAVEECTQETLIPETLMSMFGLPDITVDNLEEEAAKIHSHLYAFIKKDEEHKYRFNPVKIKEKYKRSDNMHMWPADLDQDILGQIRFEQSSATIYDIADPYTPYPDSPIPANTILLNVKYFRNEIGCDDIITAAHELIHWDIHHDYMKLLHFLDDGFKVMECTSAPIIFDEDMSPKEKARWYAEWQANELAVRVAIPKHLVEEAIDEYENSISEIYHVINSSVPHDGLYYQNMVYKLSGDFNVPKEIMKIRLRQLGYDYADGTFVTADKCLYEPFTFHKGTLKENETFVIDRANYDRLLMESQEFAELIENRYYVYTGYAICINDSKYISPVLTNRVLVFELSDYARGHANECCLKLTRHEKQYATTYTEFNYLCKLDDGEYSNVCGLTQEANNDWKSYKRMKEEEKKAQKILAEMDKGNVVSFKDALRFHIDWLNIEIEDMYDEAYLKEETFLSYYKGTRKPSLKKVMIICNKLKLPYKLCTDLLKRARITLNTEEDVDRLYDYLLTITNATLEEWELYLIENGFPSLVS